MCPEYVFVTWYSNVFYLLIALIPVHIQFYISAQQLQKFAFLQKKTAEKNHFLMSFSQTYLLDYFHSKCKEKVPLRQLSPPLPRAANLWTRVPRGCFPKHYNFNLFNSRISHYLCFVFFPSLSFISHTLFIILTITLYLEWLSRFSIKKIF